MGNYPGEQTVNVGNSIKLTTQSPWRYNHNHIGRSTDKNAITAEFTKGEIITPEGNIILHKMK